MVNLVEATCVIHIFTAAVIAVTFDGVAVVRVELSAFLVVCVARLTVTAIQ